MVYGIKKTYKHIRHLDCLLSLKLIHGLLVLECLVRFIGLDHLGSQRVLDKFLLLKCLYFEHQIISVNFWESFNGNLQHLVNISCGLKG